MAKQILDKTLDMGSHPIELGAGSAAAVSPSGKAAVRYNESLKRLESSIDGGAYADIGGDAFDVFAYRVGHRASNGQLTGWNADRLLLGGAVTAGAVTTVAPATDTLYAVPFVVAKPGTISELFNALRAGTGGSPLTRWGIYDNVTGGYMYPNSRLYGSGDITPAAVGTAFSASPALAVTPGLLWLVTLWNASIASGSYTCDALPVTAAAPMLGTPSDLLNAGGGGTPLLSVGWKHTQSYGALPASFPNSAGVPVGVAIPSLWVRFNDS